MNTRLLKWMVAVGLSATSATAFAAGACCVAGAACCMLGMPCCL